MRNIPTIKNQLGVATLFVAVIILVIMTLMVIYAARVGLMEQRISSNDVRYKEAFAIADGGVDFATQLFAERFKGISDATDNTALTALASQVTNELDGVPGPAPVIGNGTFTVNVQNNSTPGSVVYTFLSTGIGADGTANATVQRQISMSYLFGGSVPDVPIIVGGGVETGGNFNVSTNPNGGGDGVPVSVWSSGDITTSSSSATCHAEFYDGNNAQCSNPSGNDENITRGTNPETASSTYDPSKPDLLPNDENFPSDLFEFVFGLNHDDYMVKKNEADSNGQMLTDCSDMVSLGANAGDSSPLWWIDGNCSFNGGTVGSETSPVILVVEDGQLSITGNATFYGIIYLFDSDDNDATLPNPSASLGGTTEIQGSFISDVGGAAMSGSYSIVYNPNLIEAFSATNGSNYSFSYVPASWRDF